MEDSQERWGFKIGDLVEWIYWDRECHNEDDRYYTVIKFDSRARAAYSIIIESLLNKIECSIGSDSIRKVDDKINNSDLIAATCL